MSALNNSPLLGASGSQGYFLQRSVRLRSSASAYFNRTPSVAGNQQRFTWSGWVKLGTISTEMMLFDAGTGNASDFRMNIASTGVLSVVSYNGAVYTTRVETSAVLRDPSSWYHIVFAIDTTQATASNRVLIYINGVLQTALSQTTYMTQNFSTYINSVVSHTIGRYAWAASAYLDGYLTEINFVDGQALTTASFGEYNSTTGVWQPKKYAGTYGTNGFYLNFQDNSGATATTIGKDSSGNNNNWTPNNISVTAGVTYDSMTDVPTLTSPTQSNFAVLNPVNKGVNTSTSDGNLAFTSTGSDVQCRLLSTLGMSSGKWYCEYTATSSSTLPVVGIALSTESPDSGFCGFTIGSYGYYAATGFKYNNGSAVAYGATWGLNDVIGIAYDADAGTLTYYKNGTSQGVAFSGIPSGIYNFCQGDYTATYTGAFNFGQRPFSYTPPTGFVRLNTYNLPTPTIKNGAAQMAATTYTGNGAALSVANTVNGVSFQPDLIWAKPRSLANYHGLWDAVRGGNNLLYPNGTDIEAASSNLNMSVNATGWSMNGNNSSFNPSGATIVGWQWKASNAAAVTNTSGSISSQVSANPSAGFSIVTYTGTGANATVGHGLGVAPNFILVKSRSAVSNWMVGGSNIAQAGNGTWSSIIEGLNTTSAINTGGTASFNSTAPTSTVFSLGTEANTNGSGRTQVAYCFAAVAGYSAFGKYTGNGSADGTFVYLGFRPRLVMTKRTDTTGPWQVLDSSRDTYNSSIKALFPNTSGAEASFTQPNGIDFLSNGFKLRNTSTDDNASGGTYIYAAFAENPFNYSLAR